jgi:peptidyl-prolyl cis-trans isomerase SDCCAG10
VDLRDIRAQHEKEKASSSIARQAEIKEMQESLRKLKKRTGEASDSESDEESRKRRRGPSFLEEELAKYQKGRGRAILRSANTRKRREEEDDLLAAMTQFSKKVSDTPLDAIDDGEGPDEKGSEGGEPLEVDDDVDWMRHSLKFLVDEKELTRRAEDEYAVSNLLNLMGL